MVRRSSIKKINSTTDLTPDKKNSREHNARNVSMIMDSIGEVGLSRSGVIDEQGNILAGNGTYQALEKLGLKKIKVVKAAGDEWVVVQREGLSEEDKVKVSLYDNRTAELAVWDPAILQEMNEDDPEFMSRLFSAEELDSVFDLIPDEPEAMDGEDEVPEAPKKAKTKPGQVYRLGEHRLMCGDSADKTHVDSLMDGEKADMVFTDPPYGMNLDTDYSKLKGSVKSPKAKGYKWNSVIGDDKEFDPRIIMSFFEYCSEQFWWGADYYFECLPRGGSLIVWQKRDKADCKMIGNDFELCWSKGKHKKSTYWKRWVGFDSVERGEKRVHPTQKPVDLIQWILKSWGKCEDIVVDLFGGSGSTMIACEKLNRKCYMMEIDPLYCDVIVERYKKLFPENEVKKIN